LTIRPTKIGQNSIYQTGSQVVSAWKWASEVYPWPFIGPSACNFTRVGKPPSARPTSRTAICKALSTVIALCIFWPMLIFLKLEVNVVFIFHFPISIVLLGKCVSLGPKSQ